MTFDEIKEQFDKVITHSQGIEDPKTDKLFKIWYANKKKFIDKFPNGECIYEFPKKVSFELNEEEKEERIKSFIEDIMIKYQYNELGRFIESQKSGFFENLTISDFTVFNGKTIKKGTKIVKAFSNFISDEKILREIQDMASQIIQENKIEGRMCLSVHPLDFLSLSENVHNWTTCHSLKGEYRAGNLSYMMDSSTIICYIRSENDEKLPNFPEDVKWNSKKWRVLIHFSNDGNMIFAGRPYPFSLDKGIHFILDVFLRNSNLIHETWTNWNEVSLHSMTLNSNIEINFDYYYVPVGDKLLSLSELVSDSRGSKHFNDILHSSYYIPLYAVRYNTFFWGEESYLKTDVKTKFILGEYTYCLKCGEKEALSTMSSMMCMDCELKYGTEINEYFKECSFCGKRIFEEESYCDNSGDNIICFSCFEQFYKKCEECSDYINKDDLYFSEKSERYLCEYCYNEENAGRRIV